MNAGLQEWLALGLVALIVVVYLVARRRRPAGSCGDCASAAPPAKETVIRFHPRSKRPPPP